MGFLRQKSWKNHGVFTIKWWCPVSIFLSDEWMVSPVIRSKYPWFFPGMIPKAPPKLPGGDGTADAADAARARKAGAGGAGQGGWPAFGVKHGEINDQNRFFEMFYDVLNGFKVLAGNIES